MSDVYGIRVVNEEGILQIDGQLRNMRAIQYGRAQYNVDEGVFHIYYPDFGFNPIIMFNITPGYDYMPWGAVERSMCEVIITRTHTQGAMWNVIEQGVPQSVTLDYVILAPVGNDVVGSIDPYGMLLRDEAGVPCFSSAENYLSIDMLYGMSTIFPGYTYYREVVTPTPPYGKRYFSMANRPLESGNGLAMLGGFRPTETTLRLGQYGWAYGLKPFGEQMYTLIGYFNPTA